MSQCLVCHSENIRVAERFGKFSFLRCADCDVEYSDPILYDRANYERAYADYLEGERHSDFYVPSTLWLQQAGPELSEARYMVNSAQLDAIDWLCRNISKDAKVLEIGCGSGWFLGLLNASGFSATGVEIAEVPVRLLRERGYRVFHGSLEAIPNEDFDAVVLFEVLEHLPDPLSFLRNIAARFPTSPLIVSVPGSKRWTKPFRWRDLSDFPPNHLTRWNEKSLKRAAAIVGYDQIEVKFPKVIPWELA
jgi:SAM-dependent methyltransferase